MNSYYKITFEDGTVVHSDNLNWHDHAEKTKVIRRGKTSIVYANRTPVKSIAVYHNGLEKIIDVPNGYRVFQATAARAIFAGGRMSTEILGRTVGIIKDNVVVEEYNLSGESDTIIGFKL